MRKDTASKKVIRNKIAALATKTFEELSKSKATPKEKKQIRRSAKRMVKTIHSLFKKSEKKKVKQVKTLAKQKTKRQTKARKSSRPVKTRRKTKKVRVN